MTNKNTQLESVLLRRKSAAQRKEARDALTDQQQLDRLDKMLGAGKGAKKERARLIEKIVGERLAKKNAKS
jgi:hypothetical protein